MRRLFTLLVVLLALTFSSVAAGETEGRPDFATMRVKELQARAACCVCAWADARGR